MNILNNVKGKSSQPDALDFKNIGHKNILPEFNPSTKNQRIDVWLRKVNECAKVYGWDDRTTTHFAMQKLGGLAKVWYEGLNTILFSWSEWQDKLTNAFPFEQSYSQTLEDMLQRKSKFNEPIEVYYYEKLSLVNQCDISGERAVDCIIHGISDRTTRSSALALRCSHPDNLLQFLMSNKASGNFTDRFNPENKFMPDHSSSSKITSKPNNNLVYCFNCKEKGHPYLQCPRPILKCTKCNKVGHKLENCRFNIDSNLLKKDETKTVQLISNSNPNS